MALVGITAPLIVKCWKSTAKAKGGRTGLKPKKAAESDRCVPRAQGELSWCRFVYEEAAGEDLRCLVVDGKVVASNEAPGADATSGSNLPPRRDGAVVRITNLKRETAPARGRAFGLGQTPGVDLATLLTAGPKSLRSTARPDSKNREKPPARIIVA